MARLWALLCFGIKIVDHVDARPLSYPEGVKPGDQISGNAGEFWRYKHVLIRPPDDEDRMEALKMSEDVKCAVCETILHRLMKRVESNAEDHIMDALDGEPTEEFEPTGDDQEDRVNKNRRGCNKHFKDEVLLRGYVLRPCPEPPQQVVQVEDDQNETNPQDQPKRKDNCLESAGNVDSRTADTYSTRSEAVFYACENTIARHGHEVARFLAETLESGGDLAVAITNTCLQAASCGGAREKTPKTKEQGKKKKRRRKADDEEGSYWDIMNEQKAEDKKSRKRRRKRKANHAEL